MPADAPAIEIRGLSKRFPGVDALDGIDLEIRSAEVHALVGQNGAGKSTLIKILSGALAPSDGQILLRGRPARFGTPLDAITEGIAAITQEISLVPTLGAAENILLGRLPTRGGGRIDWSAVHSRGHEILSRLGFDIDLRVAVARLTIAQQQGVEIARALSRQAAIVIMDEPTSALAAREVERLLQTDRETSREWRVDHLRQPSHGRGLPDFRSHQRSTGRPPGGIAQDERDQSGGSRPAHDRARGPKGIGARSTGDRHTGAGA